MSRFLSFNNAITFWFNDNKRNLPWRHTKDPYKIWISEIMLQQTRVNQGLGYYNRFIKKFRNIRSLSLANIDEVLKLWQGLGYYSRARNIHETARKIVNEMGGIFPNEYNKIIKLKGIGKYTAAAIASICFGESVPVVDGNVYRVIARYKGIFTPINSGSAYNEFFNLAKKMMDKSDPGNFNQSIMELGATICTSKKADCKNCPVSVNCYARINNKIDLLPISTKTVKVRKRYFNYLVITCNNGVLIKKRNQNDIWKSLYDFPLIESERNINIKKLFDVEEVSNYWKLRKEHLINISKIYKHKLTHQIIYARFFKFNLSDNKMPVAAEFNIARMAQLNTFSVPRLIEKYLIAEFGIIK